MTKKRKVNKVRFGTFWDRFPFSFHGNMNQLIKAISKHDKELAKKASILVAAYQRKKPKKKVVKLETKARKSKVVETTATKLDL